jgi:glycerol-3-phosphate O-acyltransferase
MTGQVSVSIWLFAFLLIFAVLAILDRVLIPSTRWFLRRRIYRVIDEISTRLDIEIKPFQLTKRQVLIDRLVYDPQVIETIRAYSQAHDMPMEVVQKKVHGYAREIIPSFNAYLYFRIGYWIAKKVARLLYRVRMDLIDNESFSRVDPEATVVFVMNHRSNMDYILVAFLAAEKTALSYAVGEWARIWPLQTLIRSMGAYFVRRNSGNPLYRRILERYIHMATREGVCQAVFMEGGLSRDGRLREPKLGFVDYMLRGFDPEIDRDIVLIPIGINYDRTIEDRSLIRSMDPKAEKRSRWFIFRTTTGFILRSFTLMLLSRWQRFGYACVNFGTPISVREFAKERNVRFRNMDREHRFKEVRLLCDRLMESIESIIPVLPVCLVSAVLLENQNHEMDLRKIVEGANDMVGRMQSNGAPAFQSTSTSRGNIIATAVNMLVLRRIIEENNGNFRVVPEEIDILRYYANSIDHWLENEKENISPALEV